MPDPDARTLGERAADSVVGAIGSWRFLICQSVFLACWIAVNALWSGRWDVYPFILLNLMLSFQAAYASPLILLSGNRQAAEDRKLAASDYETNLKAEQEIAEEALQIAAIAAFETRLAERVDRLKDDLIAHLEDHLSRLAATHDQHGGNP